MKLTKETLKKIIKEELQLVLNEATLGSTHPGDSEMIADMKEVGYLLEDHFSDGWPKRLTSREKRAAFRKIMNISYKYYIRVEIPKDDAAVQEILQGKAFSVYDLDRIIAHLRHYPTDPRLGFGGHPPKPRRSRWLDYRQAREFTPENLPIPDGRLSNRTK